MEVIPLSCIFVEYSTFCLAIETGSEPYADFQIQSSQSGKQSNPADAMQDAYAGEVKVEVRHAGVTQRKGIIC
jgi:hypothetical protein